MPKIDDTELYPYIDYINEFDPVDEAIRRANEAAQTATIASETANAAAQTANEASETANAAAQTANNAAQEVESAIENFEGGYYPLQTVGIVDTLMSGDTETVQFIQRTSDHDGMVNVRSIRGNTIVENDELVSVNIEGITSAGTMRTIPANTYFPNGLKSANEIYDELDFVGHKATARVESFEINTSTSGISIDSPSSEPNQYGLYNIAMTFTSTAWNAHRFNTLLFPANSNIMSWLTSPLGASTAREFTAATIPGIAFNKANRKMYYRSESQLSESDFLALINTGNNNKLTAAIATPIETDLPENLQATYPIEIGGTESIVIPTGEQSAPPTFVIAYAYDADGIIDKSQSIIAPIENGTASDNYAVDSYLVMYGVLYRVTSAIASGETIAPDTNCVATTVMDEMVRLTA